MRYLFLCVLSLIVLIGAIWLCSWFFYQCEAWAKLPCVLTGTIVGAGSLCGAAASGCMIDLSKK